MEIPNSCVIKSTIYCFSVLPFAYIYKNGLVCLSYSLENLYWVIKNPDARMCLYSELITHIQISATYTVWAKKNKFCYFYGPFFIYCTSCFFLKPNVLSFFPDSILRRDVWIKTVVSPLPPLLAAAVTGNKTQWVRQNCAFFSLFMSHGSSLFTGSIQNSAFFHGGTWRTMHCRLCIDCYWTS